MSLLIAFEELRAKVTAYKLDSKASFVYVPNREALGDLLFLEDGISFPIVSYQYTSPVTEFYDTTDEYWDGEYGDLRIELLDFCIATLKAKDA